jgi:transcriptional regulator with XRE-family HTH domain
MYVQPALICNSRVLAIIAGVTYIGCMTPHDLMKFRTRMGWDRAELASQLAISASRVADYEAGRTRGKHSRPAPIPKVVELACRYLGGERAPLSKEEWIARLRDVSHLPRRETPLPDEAISREKLYDTRG